MRPKAKHGISRRDWKSNFASAFFIVILLCSASMHQLSDQATDSGWTAVIPQKSFGPEGWSEVKLLVYMTTHLSPEHIAFLPCWKDAAKRLDLFKYADLMLYTAVVPTGEQLEQLPFRKTIVKLYDNPGFQTGAIQAMIDPFLDNVTWFDEYDWVVRVNADVLIRKDEWLMQTMLNTSVDMIVLERATGGEGEKDLHSDFFAFRPSAIDRKHLLQVDRDTHAEEHFKNIVYPLLKTGRFSYLEGAVSQYSRLRGENSPVLHVHELSNFCPFYYNVTKEGLY